MRVHPDGAALSRLADRTLGPALFSVGGDRRRYITLMAANAKAIAARQIKAGDGPERLELESLAALSRESAAAADAAGEAKSVRAALVRLYEKFRDDLRAGAFDPRQPDNKPGNKPDNQPGHDAARAHLMEITRQRARESAPKALAPESKERP